MNPAPPPEAEAVFGDRLGRAEHYVALLAGTGVEHGHIGPREIPRLWDRHVLNSAAVAELVPPDAGLVDVGSGAGLPGIPLAIARPDLVVTLVEPMLKRVSFLERVVTELGLSTVHVVRGRAEDVPVVAAVGGGSWVTARAVAPLDRLMRWCLPLVRPHGVVLALKGSGAAAEIAEHRRAVRALGGGDPELVEVGTSLTEPTWVVRVTRSSTNQPARRTPVRRRRHEEKR